MKPFWRILHYIGNYKLLFTLSLVCSVIYAVMNALSAYLVGPFIKTLFASEGIVPEAAAIPLQNMGKLDSVRLSIQDGLDNILDSTDPHEVLTRLCFMIILVVFVKNIFSYIQGYMMAYVEQGVVRNLRDDLYAAYHHLPLRYFQKRKTGDLISRVVNDCNTINTNFNNAMINLMKEPVNILFLLSLMVIINWKLTLLSFAIAPPSLFIIGKINNSLRRRTTKTQDRISEITSVLDETISSIRVVKAFAMETFEVDKFKNANKNYFKAMLRLFKIRRLAAPITEVLGVSMAIGVLWIGGNMVLDTNVFASEDFLKFILFLFLLMQSAKSLSDVNVKIQVGIAATARVFEIIDAKSDVVDAENPKRIDSVKNDIRFRNVWYEYETGVPVLKGIDFGVKVGENVAIVGPSGGGKSTLVDLLPRFFDPVEGSVEIDSQSLRDYSLEDLRHLFGIVTQETILFHDTIRSNIAYGRPDIDFDDIQEAAKTANAHDFIMGFSDGYDTVIGDRGTKLSGGQKQRLVIARAILKNPPILIFDEATSALDSESESLVQLAIEKLMQGRTSFVIAHRLSTIQKATKIIVIDNGEILESGTHDQLFEKGGVYRKLYDLQFAS